MTVAAPPHGQALARLRIQLTHLAVYTVVKPMIEAKIRKVGNSAVMILTAEMLAFLDAKPGDCLLVIRSDDGALKIVPHDPELQTALEAAEEVMDDNRDLLQALA